MRRSRLRWWSVPLLLLLALPAVAWRTDLFLSALDVGPLGTEGEVDAWLERTARVHGSRAAWLEQGEVELTTRGELAFPPLRVMFGTGLADPSVELTLVFRPDTHGPYRYRLRQGDVVESGEVDTREGRDGIGFMLDSVRHLFEIPWSPPTVPFRRGLSTSRDGRDGVFLTWGEDAHATRRYDQVALWSRDGRIERMDTTGRDVAPFIVARVDFEGELMLAQLRLPRSATVTDPKGKVVHRWELLSVSSTVGRRAP